MSHMPSLARVLTPGVLTGATLLVVTGGVLAIVAPPAIPHVPEMVLSLVLLSGSYTAVGTSGAGFVEESRQAGRRVAFWLGLGAGSTFTTAVLLAALAGSLYGFLSVTTVRLLLLLGMGIAASIFAGVFLLGTLERQLEVEVRPCDAMASLEISAKELESLASGAPPEIVAVLRRAIERHRRSIQPMSHRSTVEDEPLQKAMGEVSRLLSTHGTGSVVFGSERDAASSDDDAGPALRVALVRMELLQERRIGAQVRRG